MFKRLFGLLYVGVYTKAVFFFEVIHGILVSWNNHHRKWWMELPNYHQNQVWLEKSWNISLSKQPTFGTLSRPGLMSQELHLLSLWWMLHREGGPGDSGGGFKATGGFSGGWKSHDFRSYKSCYSRWWQLKYFLFSLIYLGKWSNLTSIFQMGWFNHQLVLNFGCGWWVPFRWD